MKKAIVIIFLIISQTIFSQQKGLHLIHNKKNDTVFLVENRRIKIREANGDYTAGKFTIVNDSTISIKNKIIPLDSIVKVRKASRFSAIASPVAITIGSIFLTGGIAGAVAGGYGLLATVILVPPGLPLFIVPFTANRHKKEKYRYEIVN